MDIKIGDDTFTKRSNILEEIAYRDTWGEGADSYIAMMYERLVLMRDLLAEDESPSAPEKIVRSTCAASFTNVPQGGASWRTSLATIR